MLVVEGATWEQSSRMKMPQRSCSGSLLCDLEQVDKEQLNNDLTDGEVETNARAWRCFRTF